MSEASGGWQRPIDWLNISGDDRIMAWRELIEFVEIIVSRYNMHLVIRPCWWQHHEAIEELTALMHIRQVSFSDEAKLNAAMNWQDNFHKSRTRLAAIFVSCREGHVDASFKNWMTQDVRAALERHIIQVSANSSME